MLFSKKNPQGVDESKPYDLAVVIGRFQLPHAGHALLFNKALSLARHVLIIKGSSFQPRTIKNPFTFDELSSIISRYLISQGGSGRITIMPSTDNPYSDTAWLRHTQTTIERTASMVMGKGWSDKDVGVKKPKVCIVGNNKDESTYYLDMFPQYDLIETGEFKLQLNSTDLRRLLFTDPEMLKLGSHLVLGHMSEFLEDFLKTPEYAQLVSDYKWYEQYTKDWGPGPFLTADAVVVKSGHILLVQRGEEGSPGLGLWALPGGFVNVHKRERIFQASMRELDEETKIDVPPGLLKGSMTKFDIFDHPDRSLRGRIITSAYLYELDGHDKKPGLPKVKGSDDAKEARWFPISEVMTMGPVMFEDHLGIITSLLGLSNE